MTSGGNNLNHFIENQLTKYSASVSTAIGASFTANK